MARSLLGVAVLISSVGERNSNPTLAKILDQMPRPSHHVAQRTSHILHLNSVTRN